MVFQFLRMSVIIGLFGVSTVVAGRTVHDQRQVLVSVVNNANVNQKTILFAERVASYIYQGAGLSVSWENCRVGAPQCRPIGDPRRLVLHIEHDSKTLSSDVFGVAFLDEHGDGIYCNVFYDKILRLEHQGRAYRGMILGIVVAHELGHLLLGSHSHSAIGIMRPQLQLKDFLTIEPGVNTFTSTEEQRILHRFSPRTM